ncbi:PREDICTED: uncharacterized protein LOC109229995 [Nicotiana attenuata]|uniref:uncharacterized protein LOC109229995 n=1 Tax=Nicotiana attenuata TaxID=49451 RepID=UPI000905A1BC|nr:PREDICTED: uncharacterized protein LOC109229995 [Nicotiana attenuata]
MSNPQYNPGTPPQPTPSDSSTPSPPSTTPQPRRRRVKMLARKMVATGALSKKLNEKLKASQAQDFENSDDSFKYGSEGEGTRSSDSKKAQNSPSDVRSVLVENVDNSNVRGKGKEVAGSSPTSKLVVPAICGVEHTTVEESSKKTGGSGSGEAAEGLVILSSQADEPGSSIEETLVDVLKKVGASYDPKKRRTPTLKAPSTAKPSKKRKASSPTTAEISLPKGRATRSMVKQSESELQKALAESKKKRMDKGKAKVAEPSEAVNVEEMEQVHHEEHTTVEAGNKAHCQLHGLSSDGLS